MSFQAFGPPGRTHRNGGPRGGRRSLPGSRPSGQSTSADGRSNLAVPRGTIPMGCSRSPSQGTIHAVAARPSTACTKPVSTDPHESNTRILSIEGSAGIIPFQTADEWKASLAYGGLDLKEAIQRSDYRYGGHCDMVILDHNEGKTTGYLVSSGNSRLYRLPELDTRTFVIDGNVTTLMLNMQPGRIRIPQEGGVLVHKWINGQTIRISGRDTSEQHRTKDKYRFSGPNYDVPSERA